jgi:hypothetical protein
MPIISLFYRIVIKMFFMMENLYNNSKLINTYNKDELIEIN